MTPKKQPEKREYPDKEYRTLSIPAQWMLPLYRSLDIAAHCFGVVETAQHAPSGEVFKRLPNLILWALTEAKMWNEKTRASYTPSMWLTEKEKKYETTVERIERVFTKEPV